MAKARDETRRKTPAAADAALRSPVLEAAVGAMEVLEDLPVPVFMKARDGRYLAVNRAWEAFFGVARARFLGKRVQELYPHNPEVWQRHVAKDEELWTRPGHQSYELPVAARNRERREAVYYKATFPAAAAQPAGLVGAIFDITARKEAEEALSRSKLLLEQVFENMDQGISVADAELNMVAMNRRFQELLEFPASLCRPGVPFEAFIRYNAERGDYGPGEVDEQVRARVALARNPQPHRFVRERPNGTVLEIRGVPLPGGGFVTVYTDITERHRAERALRASEERFRRTFELAGSGVAHIGLDRRFLRANRRLCEMLGYSEAELLEKTGRELSHPADLDLIDAQRPRLYAGEQDSIRVEKRYLRKDGSTLWASATFVLERTADGRPQYEIAVFDDITALRESEERFRAVFDSANEGILIYDRDLRILGGNRAAERIVGLPLAELVGKPGFTSILECVREDGSAVTPETMATRITLRTGKPLGNRVLGIRRASGETSWISTNTSPLVRSGEAEPYGVVSVISDITERRASEEALRESEERFRHTFELAASGIAHVDLRGRLLRVNKSLCEILGYEQAELIGKSVKELSHPDDRDVTDAQRARVYRGEIDSARFEKRYLRKDGSLVWVELAVALVRGKEGDPVYEIAIFDDISERKAAEAALHAAHEELKRSNAELEQFAYVASHDLQEPLRMVSSYTQLLGRRYGGKLDADAQEFMGYIVDGAARMKQLIEDLLAYSRVGTRGKQFAPVKLEAALARALANLRAAIQESSAAVTYDALPTLPGDDSQLAQLFQNLIGNALKFRSQSVPRIHVSCSEKDREWEIAVKDNGIGIDPQYFERIFMVFQRLHNKAEYPGTGIGLAICKKVVERHGGRIWVESAPGEGTRFHFTLPKGQGEP